MTRAVFEDHLWVEQMNAKVHKSLLEEKKHQVLQLKQELLTRYGVTSIIDFEKKIADSVVAEHPGWEDLIAVENLDAQLEEIDTHLKNLLNLMRSSVP